VISKLYLFSERLEFSKGIVQETDLATIRALIPGCTNIVLSTLEQDRNGTDYVATLRGGATVNIDAKRRDRGASRFWNGEPDLALEDWSVVPINGARGKAGWTLDESKETDLVLFMFDPEDTNECFLMAFQLLRVAFRRNHSEWISRYKDAFQRNPSWRSHCIFVPVSTVLDAIREVSCGTITAMPEYES
jgi:hypothetical protein